MAELSSADRRRIEQAVAEAEAGGAAAADTRAARLDLPDPKPFFCENWPTARAILEFLLPFLPDRLRAPVQALIRIGDRVHQAICS